MKERGQAVSDANEVIVELLGVCVDITDRTAAPPEEVTALLDHRYPVPDAHEERAS